MPHPLNPSDISTTPTTATETDSHTAKATPLMSLLLALTPMTQILATLVLTPLLSACSGYAVTLNEKVLYTPPPLLRDFQIADAKLRTCIEQTISDQRITKPAQLKRLSCTYGGIQSLQGIELFDQLEALNLTGNQLVNLNPVAQLSQLKLLIVKQNELSDITAMLPLLHLKEADISGNAKLTCGDVLQQLAKNFEGKLTLPEQCRKKNNTTASPDS